jgi:hypothetical protein
LDPYIGLGRGGSTCPLRLVPRQEWKVGRRADLEPDEAEHQNPEHNGGRRDGAKRDAAQDEQSPKRPLHPWHGLQSIRPRPQQRDNELLRCSLNRRVPPRVSGLGFSRRPDQHLLELTMPLRFLLATALAGALAATAMSPPTAATAQTLQRRGQLTVSSVTYDPLGADTALNYHLNREVVTITNHSGRARLLTGWTLRDQGSEHVYRFPRTRLRPDRSVTVHTGRGDDSGRDRYWDLYNYAWNNGGDQAILRSRAGRTVDLCSWGDGDGSTHC